MLPGLIKLSHSIRYEGYEEMVVQVFNFIVIGVENKTHGYPISSRTNFRPAATLSTEPLYVGV